MSATPHPHCLSSMEMDDTVESREGVMAVVVIGIGIVNLSIVHIQT